MVRIAVLTICGCVAALGCGRRAEDLERNSPTAAAGSADAPPRAPSTASSEVAAPAKPLDDGKMPSPDEPARIADSAPRDGGDGGGAPSLGEKLATTPAIQTVFLIIMENKNWSDVAASASAAYINGTLAPQASIASNYRGPKRGKLHPSEPNYLWLEGGDDFGVADDNDPSRNHQATDQHLVTLLERGGIEWRSYQEDIPGDACPLTAVARYRPKHNPMVYFDDVTDGNSPRSARCIEHVRPLTELPEALAGSKTLGRYNLIIPNMCNDMHDPCSPRYDSIEQGDRWLAAWIPQIQASDAYRRGGVIIVTWDEAEQSRRCPGADCPIGFLVLSPLAKGGGYTSSLPYDHSSTLKSLQQIFGVQPLLRSAAGAEVNDLSDLFTTYP